MSLVQLRQKEFSFRREETVRTSVRERRNEGTKERKKQGREKGAEEADDPEVVRPAERETLQKRARIMNILKSHKALSAGFHSRRFFNPCTSGTTSTSAVLSLSYPFLARSHASFSRDHLPLVSFPLPLSSSPFSFPRLIPSAFLPLPFASRSINARFLRWHD